MPFGFHFTPGAVRGWGRLTVSLVLATAAMAQQSVATASPDGMAQVVAPEQVQVVDGAVAIPLTKTAGDAAAGRRWFIKRELGNCLACHANSDTAEEQFHGEVGPTMNGVAERYSTAELRAIIVNSKQVFGPQTIMPSFYRASGFNRPHKKFAGTTILSAQQVEDVVAYLETLK